MSALEKSSFEVHRAVFGGEASREEVDRIAALGRAHGADFVLALGGGKTIDTAKTVADGLAVPVAVVPTTASTEVSTGAGTGTGLTAEVVSPGLPHWLYAGYGHQSMLVTSGDAGGSCRGTGAGLISGMAEAFQTRPNICSSDYVCARRTDG